MATRLWRGWLALLALAVGAFGLVTAQAAWRAVADHARPPMPAVMQTIPVAAAAGPAARPAGATGTIALPPLPVPAPVAAAIVAADAGITAARPFSLAGVSATDRARALQCLTDAVYYEAASEPDAGQRAVAQVVLNRVRHPAFPATVCGVVYQGSAARGCQFSFACDGALARVPSRSGGARAARVAAAALAGHVEAAAGLATHYHTYAVTPAWNRSLVMTEVAGAHFFHRWKGYWGTAAAFRQVYAGGEPPPGPLGPVVRPLPPLGMAAPPATPSTTIRAAYADTSVAIAPAEGGDRLPPAATVLPKWRDAGKPL